MNIDILLILCLKSFMAKKSKQQPTPLAILKELMIFRTADAVKAGVSQPTLSRLAASGKIVRIEHGLYFHPKAAISGRDMDFAIACARFGPNAAIGGLTALYRYGLIAEVPDRIWIVVSQNVKTTSPLYRCLRTTSDLTIGIEEKRLYRITTIERTILEALRYAKKFGLSLSLNAARSAIKQGKTNETKLYAAATALNLRRILEKHWEAIVPA